MGWECRAEEEQRESIRGEVDKGWKVQKRRGNRRGRGRKGVVRKVWKVKRRRKVE